MSVAYAPYTQDLCPHKYNHFGEEVLAIDGRVLLVHGGDPLH